MNPYFLDDEEHAEGKIRFTQLIREGGGRWLHLSYVPSDLKCQVIP